ncbi:MAG: divergent PAP2 family protein [Oscillospiraceae bacterium]|nr:divergent PAP2 family protein [Oscillospiraceae bacterium]
MVKYVLAIFGGNLILSLSILAWAVAQVSKFFVNLATSGNRDWHYLLTGGGMPSSHSATVCACASSVAYFHGFGSTYFALAAVMAVVVMYDAFNVRQETGKQARVLNYIMENWPQMKPEEIFDKALKELVGHTPLQVFMGGVLGVAIGWGGSYLLG